MAFAVSLIGQRQKDRSLFEAWCTARDSLLDNLYNRRKITTCDMKKIMLDNIELLLENFSPYNDLSEMDRVCPDFRVSQMRRA